MSFSFRNIFNPEDGESEGSPFQAGGDSRHQSPFSAPEGAGRKSIPHQTFQVSELLPFIPPAIAAQTGIPMTKEVDIPLSADGSNDVLLSTIYEVCPELFAAEITPLNESTVTLPAKLSSPPEPTPGSNSPFTPGAAFSKPPGMAASSPKPAQNASSASTGSEKSNPFWSPEEDEKAPENKQQPLNDMSEPHSQPRAASNSAEGKTPQGLGGFEKPQMKNPSPSPFNSGDAEVKKSGTQPSAQDAVPNGFSAPAASNPFEQKAPSDKEKPPHEEKPAPSSQFSGNPFESDEGYSTLFSTQAEEDAEIPFPSPSAKPVDSAKAKPTPGDSPDGTWGTMFDAKADPDGDSGSDAISKGFESIGNLIPGSSKAPEAPDSPNSGSPSSSGGNAFGSPDDDDDDYGLFLPPVNEEHELPSVFQSADPAASAPEVETSEETVEVSKEEEPNRPSFGFEAATQSIPKGFSETKSEPPVEAPASTPAPADESAARAQGSAFSGSSFPSALPQSQPQPAVSVEPEEQSVPEPVATPQPVAKVEPEPEPEMETIAAPAPAPVATNVGLPGLSHSNEIRDLELRAIFSTNDPFTLRSVARRVVALPGISSCALATPGRLVQASRNEESRIGDEAKEMVQTIRNLAKLTGLPDAQSFTLHTDKGIVSIFLDGECCLTVHHEVAEFEPGTREKLILISRNLEKLEK
ncbi:MAG: hypothetical protein P1U86_20345 [Verrucomicrobiales bacterium]|nr:hypothetical protein [Verrucomicrobiales bacterium]